MKSQSERHCRHRQRPRQSLKVLLHKQARMRMLQQMLQQPRQSRRQNQNPNLQPTQRVLPKEIKMAQVSRQSWIPKEKTLVKEMPRRRQSPSQIHKVFHAFSGPKELVIEEMNVHFFMILRLCQRRQPLPQKVHQQQTQRVEHQGGQQVPMQLLRPLPP